MNRYTSRGTHTATGRTYEILTIDMVRVRNGQIVEHWALRDQAAMDLQLGLATADASDRFSYRLHS